MVSTTRIATSEDIEIIKKISKETIIQQFVEYLDQKQIDAFLHGAGIDEYLRNNLSNCILLIEDSEVKGMAVCNHNRIDLMIINPETRKEGYGSKLLKSLETRLFQRYNEIIIEVFNENKSGIAFLQSQNWLESRRFIDMETKRKKIAFSKIFF